jgi:hypothetical protein
MKTIAKWITDEKAREAGMPEILTHGEITTSNGVKIVRFREEIKHNGKWVVCCVRVDTRPELADVVAQIEEEDKKEKAIKAEIEKRTVSIYLSSRGWGDYSSCEWTGDITRSNEDILAECRALLTNGHDVDQRNQSDDEIIKKIIDAREKWETAPARKAAREAEEKADIEKKIKTGYCFNCETYCHGDCGHYSSDPSVKFHRDFKQAMREANYGIQEG